MIETATAKARVTRRAFVTCGKKADGFYHRDPLGAIDELSLPYRSADRFSCEFRDRAA